MRLSDSEHTGRPWRIHEIASDFVLEDVWALPTPGGAADFPQLVDLMARSDPSHDPSPIVRGLFALRWWIGGRLGWDDDEKGIDGRVATLRSRLPADLRTTPVPEFAALPFVPLYVTDREFAAEIANATMHGILHLGWVPDPAAEGGYRGQMAVLVSRNGPYGALYMAAIAPFRHRLVYPRLLADLERRWRATRR